MSGGRQEAAEGDGVGGLAGHKSFQMIREFPGPGDRTVHGPDRSYSVGHSNRERRHGPGQVV